MHQWSTTPLNNQTADARAQFPEGQPIPTLNNGARGMMATAALWRDDNLGAVLLATLGQNNVYTVSTGQGLIDSKTQGTGLTANITHPYSLNLAFDTALSGSVANPPKLVVDGAPSVPLLRSDGSVLRDGDIQTGRPYALLGDFAVPGTDTAVTRVRIMASVRSTIADLARAAGIGRRNRILDPGFQQSTLNGTNALPLVSGTPAWPSDGVSVDFVGGGGATVQKFAGQTVSGAEFFHRLTVTTANASPGASDRLRFVIPFEGQAMADLLFGTSSARMTCFSTDVRFPAGSYGYALRNGSTASRSYCGTFTISPAQNQIWTEIDLPIPGDVAGSWAVDSSRGMELCISVLTGSGKQAAAGWQGNDYFSANLSNASGPITNGMAAAGNTFDIGAPRFSQGSAPQDFELPDPTLELHKCRRWLRKETRYSILTDQTATTAIALIRFDEPMRAQPQISVSAPQKLIIPGQNYFTQAVGSGAAIDFTGDPSTGAIVTLLGFTGLPRGVGGFSYPDSGQYLLLDARP
jgi:hypothetical protein